MIIKIINISKTHFYDTIIYYINLLSGQRKMKLLDNGPGDLGSIPGRVIPKTQKMVLDASLVQKMVLDASAL